MEQHTRVILESKLLSGQRPDELAMQCGVSEDVVTLMQDEKRKEQEFNEEKVKQLKGYMEKRINTKEIARLIKLPLSLV